MHESYIIIEEPRKLFLSEPYNFRPIYFNLRIFLLFHAFFELLILKFAI
jgi:hypothetical protein